MTSRGKIVADVDAGAALGYFRPDGYEELRAVLSSGMARPPNKLRQATIFVWRQPTAVALGTVTSVAARPRPRRARWTRADEAEHKSGRSGGMAMGGWRVVGVSFEHAHMGDLLREVHEHPQAEIAGVCDPDPARMADAIANFAISPDRVFRDIAECVAKARPDLAVLCPATARHAEVVEAVAALGVDILLEKPFAASLADADRILAAVAKAGVRLAVNWPLRWYPSHVTAKRLIDEAAIGEVVEVHFYDGNRGPLYHRADKVVVSDEDARREKPTSWWYKKAAGGGSLLDYLGYGATLGTWFLNGEAPIEVTAVVDQPAGLEVDEHSITICRYRRGLSKLETRWGAFTDPWITQPQPKCGFVIVGAEGTISSYDFEAHVGLQTRAHPTIRAVPVDELKAPFRRPVEYVLHCKEHRLPFEGPLDPALCRTAQRIVDTAALSARERRTLALQP